MLKIEKVDNFEEFLKLEPIWNDLLSQSDADLPFLTFEWITLWWEIFGVKDDMLILLIKNESELVAIAPLRITKTKLRSLPVTAIAFIGNYYSNRLGLIINNKATNKKEVFLKIASFLQDTKYNFDLISLDLLESDSATELAIKNYVSLAMPKYRKMDIDLSPYLLIDQDWDSYLKSRSSNFRSKLSRTRNGFYKMGNFRIIKYQAFNALTGMDELLSISKNTWKYKNGTAIANKKESIAFFTKLAKEASKIGWLNLWILKLNSVPVSFVYNLLYKNKIYFLKVGFNEEYRKMSPGLFLTETAVKDAFVNGYKEFDFLGANEDYKLKFASLCRQHCKYWIFNASAFGIFLSFIESNFVPKIKYLLKAKATKQFI